MSPAAATVGRGQDQLHRLDDMRTQGATAVANSDRDHHLTATHPRKRPPPVAVSAAATRGVLSPPVLRRSR